MGACLSYERCSAKAFQALKQNPSLFESKGRQDDRINLGLLRDGYRLQEILSPSERCGPGLEEGPATTAFGRAIVGSRPLYQLDDGEYETYSGVYIEFGTPYYLDPSEVRQALTDLNMVSLKDAISEYYSRNRWHRYSMLPSAESDIYAQDMVGISLLYWLDQSLNALKAFYQIASAADEYVMVWMDINGWGNANIWANIRHESRS